MRTRPAEARQPRHTRAGERETKQACRKASPLELRMPKAGPDVRIEALPCAAASLKEEPPIRLARRQQMAGQGLKCLIRLDQAGMAEWYRCGTSRRANALAGSSGASSPASSNDRAANFARGLIGSGLGAPGSPPAARSAWTCHDPAESPRPTPPRQPSARAGHGAPAASRHHGIHPDGCRRRYRR